ncbi:hypothetical protein LSTR_LSTR004939 [Laodelphax striatellus]|uniref:Glutaredoxin-2, mitochondrial n=1 Tax=Laodelphax striatellus TaxID=195883 RepID=A0A482XP00_LAOST|nr:hypothetical protein LSTR_LSTR004939 [Laodelphax striatellus]
MDLISCPRLPPKGPVDMDGPIAKYVKDTIAQDMVVIFSKTYCPYCKLAKEVFDGIKKTYTCVELDNRNDGDSIQNILGVITGARTVPRVFVNGVCIGGGSDVKELHEKGELQKLLAAK